MKNTVNLKCLFLLLLAIGLFSCEKVGDENLVAPEIKTDVAFVINYGSYSSSAGEISIYYPEGDSIKNNNYKAANGIEFNSRIESAGLHDSLLYLMSNKADKIDILNTRDIKSVTDPITDVIKPRHFISQGNTAYVSCWGEVNDWSVMANGYIAKINLTDNSIKKIALPNGPEGVIIANNRLYAGLTNSNKVAVIDLATEAITYINVAAVPQQFVKDGDGNIWVSLVSKYSTPFGGEYLGIAKIDTKENKVVATVNYPGIGSDGFIEQSPDKSKIYIMGSEAYPGTKSAICVVDVASKSIDNESLISGERFTGFGVNPGNGNIYILITAGSTSNGSLKVYDANGNLLDEKEAGISPKHVLFYEVSQKNI